MIAMPHVRNGKRVLAVSGLSKSWPLLLNPDNAARPASARKKQS
jgi:hypothetical protein